MHIFGRIAMVPFIMDEKVLITAFYKPKTNNIIINSRRSVEGNGTIHEQW